MQNKLEERAINAKTTQKNWEEKLNMRNKSKKRERGDT